MEIRLLVCASCALVWALAKVLIKSLLLLQVHLVLVGMEIPDPFETVRKRQQKKFSPLSPLPSLFIILAHIHYVITSLCDCKMQYFSTLRYARQLHGKLTSVGMFCLTWFPNSSCEAKVVCVNCFNKNHTQASGVNKLHHRFLHQWIYCLGTRPLL